MHLHKKGFYIAIITGFMVLAYQNQQLSRTLSDLESEVALSLAPSPVIHQEEGFHVDALEAKCQNYAPEQGTVQVDIDLRVSTMAPGDQFQVRVVQEDTPTEFEVYLPLESDHPLKLHGQVTLSEDGTYKITPLKTSGEGDIIRGAQSVWVTPKIYGSKKVVEVDLISGITNLLLNKEGFISNRGPEKIIEMTLVQWPQSDNEIELLKGPPEHFYEKGKIPYVEAHKKNNAAYYQNNKDLTLYPYKIQLTREDLHMDHLSGLNMADFAFKVTYEDGTETYAVKDD